MKEEQLQGQRQGFLGLTDKTSAERAEPLPQKAQMMEHQGSESNVLKPDGIFPAEFWLPCDPGLPLSPPISPLEMGTSTLGPSTIGSWNGDSLGAKLKLHSKNI